MPDTLTVCGLRGALSLTLSVPVAVPVAVGVNVMLTLQVLPAARVAPQVLAEMAKGALTVNPVKSSVSAPVFTFLIFTDLALLVVPTFWSAKDSEEGVKVGSRATLLDRLKTVPHPPVVLYAQSDP